MATTIPPEIKETVTFIFIEDKAGKKVPNGTGFFIGVKNEKDSQISHAYLVTAKHVIMNKKTGKYFDSIYIRLNKRSGDLEGIKIPLSGEGSIDVYVHPDVSVDIAVIPILPDPKIYEIKLIPEDMIITKEKFKELNIREGDEVFFLGLFTHFYGIKRNYPISRFGRVSIITDEKIPWQEEKGKPPKMLDLYLIESQSFGGNSGSPVFFYLGIDRKPGSVVIGGTRLLLAGVMKGSFLEGRGVEIIETNKIPIFLQNVGIAAVIPAFKLHEILYSKKLKEKRIQRTVIQNQ